MAEPSGAAPANEAAVELPVLSFAAEIGTTNQLSAASAVATGIASSAIRTSSSRIGFRSVLAAGDQLQIRRVRAPHGAGGRRRYARERWVRVLAGAVRAADRAGAADGVAGVRELLGVVADRVHVTRVDHRVRVLPGRPVLLIRQGRADRGAGRAAHWHAHEIATAAGSEVGPARGARREVEVHDRTRGGVCVHARRPRLTVRARLSRCPRKALRARLALHVPGDLALALLAGGGEPEEPLLVALLGGSGRDRAWRRGTVERAERRGG